MAHGADALAAAAAKAAVAAQHLIRAYFGREDAEVVCTYPS